MLIPQIPPWNQEARVTFRLDVGPPRTDATAEEGREAATKHLASLLERAVWAWADGSAVGGVISGVAGAIIDWPEEEAEEL